MTQAGAWLWCDGELVETATARGVSVFSHALHHGYGAFEGVRAYRRKDGQGCIFRLDDHLSRLFDSCRLLCLEPRFGPEEVRQACLAVLRANALPEAYLRPLVVASDGAYDLRRGEPAVVTYVMAWSSPRPPGEDALARGVRCKLSSYSRPAAGSAFVRGKIAGEQVTSIAARRDATRDGYDDALLFDTRGCLAGGTGSHLFLVEHGELATPPLASGVLPGITRDTLLTLALEEGVVVRERDLSRDDLFLADEAFLAGTLVEVTPIREVDGRPIGRGSAGAGSARAGAGSAGAGSGPGGARLGSAAAGHNAAGSSSAGHGWVGPVTRALRSRFFELVRGADDSHPEWLTVV